MSRAHHYRSRKQTRRTNIHDAYKEIYLKSSANDETTVFNIIEQARDTLRMLITRNHNIAFKIEDNELPANFISSGLESELKNSIKK